METPRIKSKGYDEMVGIRNVALTILTQSLRDFGAVKPCEKCKAECIIDLCSKLPKWGRDRSREETFLFKNDGLRIFSKVFGYSDKYIDKMIETVKMPNWRFTKSTGRDRGEDE